MADECCFCETRRPQGGTNHLVLNGGALWLEFCGPCGEKETLTNPETGETLTVKRLFDRCENGGTNPVPKPEPIGGPEVTRVFGTSLSDVLEGVGV